MNAYHKEILQQIRLHAGRSAKNEFLNSYLGNHHPIYPIRMPVLRKIAKEWMSTHRTLSSTKFSTLLTSLIKGESSTEKIMVGILLDYATLDQKKFNPTIFNTWLNYLEGWAEVDALCTGRYTDSEILSQWTTWKPLLLQLSKSSNIHKRRASLVLLCSPLRKIKDDRLSKLALQNVSRLSFEKEILITKAISWVLRNMVNLYRSTLKEFIENNQDTLPKIALRETLTKLRTGKKTTTKK